MRLAPGFEAAASTRAEVADVSPCETLGLLKQLGGPSGERDDALPLARAVATTVGGFKVRRRAFVVSGILRMPGADAAR